MFNIEFGQIINALHSNFSFVLIPLFIYVARICDVTIGTLRIMFVARGQKKIAPFLGFIEVLIWITVLGSIMQNLTNPLSYIAYAGGFATGNFLGIRIEEHLALGKVLLRIISSGPSKDLIDSFVKNNLGVTYISAKGSRGSVLLIYSVLERKKLPDALQLIKNISPKAFYSIEDVRRVNEGIF